MAAVAGSGRGRRIRLLLPPVVAVLLLLGTWVGQDDNFPFGPFRMYSTKQGLEGEVHALQLWGKTAAGDWTILYMDDFGLRRADLEGQLGKLAQDPTAVLRELSESYRRLHDGAFPYGALEFRQEIYELHDGEPASSHAVVVGDWAPS